MITPDWAMVRPLVVEVEAHVAQLSPAERAELDQLQANSRDWFDSCGVSFADPGSLYCGLLFLTELLARLRICARAGVVDPVVPVQMAPIIRGAIACYLPFLPDEVRS